MLYEKYPQQYIPYLPHIPNEIYGQPNFIQNLTNRTANEWQFLFRAIRDIPSPYAENQDYDFSRIGNAEWKFVLVPSSLIMQGFDIENNTEYYYKRTLRLPKVRKTDKLVLRFEGVYSNARIWVNNRFVKTHVGGFTPWDCDISAFADAKEITLVVGVTDVEGNQKPDCGWERDNENNFLYLKVRGRRKISNDFLTRRNHIRRYTVSFTNGQSLTVFNSDGHINAYVRRSENENNGFELQITTGCYYPDLQWGNYFGKPLLSIKHKIIQFSFCVHGGNIK